MANWFWVAPLLALAELGVRLHHRRDGDRWMDEGLRPSFRGHGTGPGSAKRVIVLGDSIPFGEGVAEHEAYPSILASMLTEAHPKERIRVLNAGIRGQTVLQGWARLERHVLRQRPHLVIVAFGLNDASLGRSPLDAWREEDFWQRRQPIFHRVVNASHILRAIHARARRRRYLKFVARAQPRPQHTRVSPKAYQTCLADVSRRLRSSCKVMLVTMTPLGSCAFANLTAAGRQRQVALQREYDSIARGVAQSEGTALAELGKLSQMHGKDRLWAPDGIHLRPGGHRGVARILCPLVEVGLFSSWAQAR